MNTETVIHLTHLLPFNRHHCLWFCHRNGMEGTSLVMSTSALGTYLLLAHTSHLKSSNWVKSIPIPPSQLTWCLDVIKLYFPLLFLYWKWIRAVQILANVSAAPAPQENFLRPLKKCIWWLQMLESDCLCSHLDPVTSRLWEFWKVT